MTTPTTDKPTPYVIRYTIRYAILFVLLAMLPTFLIRPWSPIFSPLDMASISRTAIAQTAASNGTAQNTITHVIAQLRHRYPQHILNDMPWLFSNAGGAMGSMLVLHFSPVEYLIIFGTAIGSSGHSGRFMADDYFTILHGEQWATVPGAFTREVYHPGDQHLMLRGTSKHYTLVPDSWALEYARGNIFSMLPFGLADSLFSTFDIHTLFSTIRVAAFGLATSLRNRITNWIQPQ